ncbi:hypothetical protein ACLB2K_025458 [Fragaria x ananassa]
MASADAKLPTVFFFFLLYLLFIFHTTMAREQKSFQIPTVSHDSSRHGAGRSIRRTAVEYSARGSPGTGSSNKVDSFAHESSRSRGSRGRRRNSKRQEEVFNAGEHEIPSGPNPISNR